MKLLITQKGKRLERVNLLVLIISFLAIWAVIIPIFILDISINIYQKIYFTLQGIPKIKRGDYIIFDRWALSKLSFAQKMSCIYCSYANGTAAWFKAISNQTEIYSCAIKHKYNKGGQEHQGKFDEYKEYL